MALTESEKQTLLAIARSSIEAAVHGEVLPSIYSSSKELERLSGVFVTIKIDDDLRGCIGYIEPVFPLAQAAQEVAVKAAMEDPRFDPITSAELNLVDIEISVLSVLDELNDVDTIVIGKHGLVLEAGHYRGLLLPQVATEYQWTREEFLDHTALKAGLPANAWKQKNVRLFTFTVELFSEKNFT